MAHTILCVDDDKLGLQTRKALLEIHGYTVIACSDSTRATQLFEKNRVDLVVLDYRMPDLDGGALARQFRALRADVPILLLSGFLREVPPEIVPLIDAFLEKGRPPTLLLATIKRLLSRGLMAWARSA